MQRKRSALRVGWVDCMQITARQREASTTALVVRIARYINWNQQVVTVVATEHKDGNQRAIVGCSRRLREGSTGQSTHQTTTQHQRSE